VRETLNVVSFDEHSFHVGAGACAYTLAQTREGSASSIPAFKVELSAAPCSSNKTAACFGSATMLTQSAKGKAAVAAAAAAASSNTSNVSSSYSFVNTFDTVTAVLFANGSHFSNGAAAHSATKGRVLLSVFNGQVELALDSALEQFTVGIAD
jgi:hypothetical protein